MIDIRLRARTFSILPAVALLAVLGGACSGSTEPGGGAAEAVVMTPDAASIPVGNSLQLKATALDANRTELPGREPAWASADSLVAAVSSAGLVVARKIGTVQIQAVIEGKSAFAFVTVVPRPVATVTVSPASATVGAGATAQLQAALADDRGNRVTDQPVTWRSSNDAVALVSSTGLVSGVAPGTATITAMAGEGKSGTAIITVPGPPPPPTGNRAPVVDFALGCTNLICAFTDLSTDTDGAVLQWHWEFGDGVTSPHRNSDNVYTSAGSFTVKLTVVDDQGATGSASKTVTPNTAAPVVQLVNRATGRCLSIDVAGSADPRGAPVISRVCDGGPDQRYSLPTGAGVGPLQLPRYDNRYVELPEGYDQRLRAWQWNGAQFQRWSYVTSTGALRSYVSNYCLTARSDSRTITAESCGGQDSQRWDVRP